MRKGPSARPIGRWDAAASRHLAERLDRLASAASDASDVTSASDVASASDAASTAFIATRLTDPDVRQRLADYARLLLKWNRTFNLLGAADPVALIDEHLIDALATLPALARHLTGTAAPRLHDVGSGAGLPGIPLAIAWPELPVVLIEPIGKKAAFLRQAIAELELSNVRVIEARLTPQLALTDPGLVAAAPSRLDSSQPVATERAVTPHFICRALTTLADFAALCRPHVSDDSLLFAMKAIRTEHELAALAPDIRVRAVERLPVPAPGVDRRLVVLSYPESNGDPEWRSS
ncbi:MAG: 16S rRNA (guanine(527)-N(7))-methyltransferase RsmG [Lautropia sp.]